MSVLTIQFFFRWHTPSCY